MATAMSRNGRHRPRAVVLFTGNPRAEEARKQLPRRFLGHLQRALIGAVRATRGVDLIVASDTGGGFRIASSDRVRTVRCNDLGERVNVSLETASDWGYRSVMIVAGDVAGLEPAWFDQAFDVLEQTDAVVAPSRDGGFSVVGLHAGATIDWSRIPWFTDSAADGLRRELRRAGLASIELDPVDDVDDPASALRLARAPHVDSRTRALLLGLLRNPSSLPFEDRRPAWVHAPLAIDLRAPPSPEA